MDLLFTLVSFILHIDTHLATVIQTYGTLTYGIIFFIIFMETGFVVTPFLPGDSLLFAAGAFSATGSLSITTLFLLLAVAAIAGDTANYWLGHFIGPKAFSGQVKFLKKEYLDRTHAFYEKHGGITIILARFIPIIRTFAPFVAGVGAMTYGHFIMFNVVGGILWVSLFLFGGYFFGNIPVVKHNFSLVIMAIILISVLPGIIEFLKHRSRKHRTVTAEADATQ